MKLDEAPDGGLPRLPIGPGRAAYSKRTRSVVAAVLALVVVVALIAGIALVSGSSHAPIRSVTIPVADRSAPPPLLRAAEAVGFEPTSEPGAGSVESEPIARGAARSQASLLPPGTTAPAFRLQTPAGAPLALSSLRGKTVLLEFFATWCPHCAAEAPHLKQIYASVPHAHYAFVGIDADGETAPSVLAYHIYFGFPFPALLDPSTRAGDFHHPGATGTVSKAYEIAEFPTFYVIGPDGKIAWAASGEQPDARLVRELRAAA